ncbi:MAG: Ig-like domain-containing protein [Acidobacteriaceae bacterium]|nr:Ig-like domain-containing protein [Acidobacteriaceae bacterium]
MRLAPAQERLAVQKQKGNTLTDQSVPKCLASFLLLIALAWTGCGGGTVSPPTSSQDSGPSSIASITLTPQTASVTVGATQKFAATAQDQDGKIITGTVLSYATSNPNVAAVDANGIATGIAPGTSEIKVSADGITSSALFTVTPKPSFTLSAEPATATVAQGQSVQSMIVVNPANGFASNVSLAAFRLPSGVSASFSPISSTEATLTLTASASAVVGTATVVITGTSGALTAQTGLSLIVAPAPSVLTKISVSPASASIQVGSQESFTAVGLDQYNKPMPGIAFTWATNTNCISLNAGSATGLCQGTGAVIASAQGVSSAPALLTVLPPPPALTTIVLTPANPSILTTGSQQFAAAGIDQYGNPMSGIAFTFSSSNPNVATINGNGLANGPGGPNGGTTAITASSQGVIASTTLTTTRPAAILTTISATPSTATVQAGSSTSFSVTGLDQFGLPITGLTFAWVSSNPSVATVNAINSEGQNGAIATGVAQRGGSVTLTASAQGIISAPVNLTVTPAPPALTTISITPTNASVNVGTTQTFTASGTDQFGAPFPLSTVQFSSENPNIATMNGNVATGVAAGTAQITATSGSVTGLVFLTVTTPPPPPPMPPVITRLSPPLALTGSADLTYLTITGSNFATGATVNFGSNILTPASITSNTITVTIPAPELKSAATVAVSISNPAPQAATSTTLPFLITSSGFVSIDFDDGYQSMYDNGLPIFDAAGIRTTQYIITGNTLGGTIVNPSLGPVGVGNTGFLTWDEVQTMAANGHEIGAHTRTHQSLSTLCQVPDCAVADTLTNEISGSKADLIAHKLNPLTFAYPYGDYGYPNSTIGLAVQNAGFLGARDSDSGYNGKRSGHGQIMPYYLWSEAGETDLNTTLANLTGYIDYAVANKLWLILLFHRVDDNSPDNVSISISSTILQGIVNHIVQKNVNVVTNSEGLVIENLNGQTQPFVFPD